MFVKNVVKLKKIILWIHWKADMYLKRCDYNVVKMRVRGSIDIDSLHKGQSPARGGIPACITQTDYFLLPLNLNSSTNVGLSGGTRRWNLWKANVISRTSGKLCVTSAGQGNS